MKLLFFLLLSVAASANAEIYKWSDRAGVVHFSNSMDDVPDRYRAKAKSMNYGSDQKGDPAGGQTQPSGAAVSPPVDPQVKQISPTAAEPSKKDAIRRRVGRTSRHVPLERGDEE